MKNTLFIAFTLVLLNSYSFSASNADQLEKSLKRFLHPPENQGISSDSCQSPAKKTKKGVEKGRKVPHKNRETKDFWYFNARVMKGSMAPDAQDAILEKSQGQQGVDHSFFEDVEIETGQNSNLPGSSKSLGQSEEVEERPDFFPLEPSVVPLEPLEREVLEAKLAKEVGLTLEEFRKRERVCSENPIVPSFKKEEA
jgi:hypothetical protein